MSRGPLAGVRVIEMGQLIAGPFAGAMLAYFGAEVIKIEAPTGDPLRGWRHVEAGTSFWWRSIGRNKKSVTLDLNTEAGREIVQRLLKSADVLIENFRPGVMEKWGLGPEAVSAFNSGLIYSRISGYGQTGPYANKPGFASVCEAFSGFRYVNGFPGEAPVRPNLSIGDSVAGLHAALGVVMALYARDAGDAKQKGRGQVVDVALFESMFNLMEGVVPEYSGAGVIREPSGTTVTGIVPTNTYRCADGKYVVIGGNGDSIFKRLMTAIGRSDLANNPDLAHNAGRVAHENDIDVAINAWCGGLDQEQVLLTLEAARVPSGPIYNVEDMAADPHYRARSLFETVQVNGKTLEIPAMVPRLQDTPGATHWPGGEIGSHNREVLLDELGLSEQYYAELQQCGVIR
ncbi:MAG: CoA transferase [Gammaproteobacteria bacterium]